MNDERARLFVALELPEEVQEELVVWRENALGGLSAVRRVSRESLHVTLCFLGSLPVTEVDAVWEACGAAVVGVVGRAPPSLVLGAAVWLPARRPRVLAVSVGDRAGALAATQALLSGALVQGGWYRPEARPFLAHVTVARVGRGAVVRAVELPAPPAIEFVGSTVTLFRSHLGRGGARYEALRSAELRVAGDVGIVVARGVGDQSEARQTALEMGQAIASANAPDSMKTVVEGCPEVVVDRN